MTSVGIIFSAAQLKRLCDGLSEKVGVRFNNSQLRRLVRMPLSLRGLSSDTVELGFESYFNLHFSYNSKENATDDFPPIAMFTREKFTMFGWGGVEVVCMRRLPQERHKVSRWGEGTARSRYLDKGILWPLRPSTIRAWVFLQHFVAKWCNNSKKTYFTTPKSYALHLECATKNMERERRKPETNKVIRLSEMICESFKNPNGTVFRVPSRLLASWLRISLNLE